MSDEKSKSGIVLHNKLKGYIQLIEVGIVCPKNRVHREYQKKCKYFRLVIDIQQDGNPYIDSPSGHDLVRASHQAF